MTDKMQFRKEGPVAYIVFNNPAKRNAVSQEMWAAIAPMFDDLEADPNIRVVVLTGAGGKSFVAGADISEFEKNRNSVENAKRYSQTSDYARKRLRDTLKPTIAMIRGYCIGGGLAVAMGCDIRIATDGSKFGIPAAKLGIAYGAVSVGPLVSLVGPAVAKEMLYTGRQYDAATALRIGLINQVVPDAALETHVQEMAATIAANAPLSVKAAKLITNEMLKSNPDFALCDRLTDACVASEDYEEGRHAFMEKRTPAFVGR
jgi:enoyl-CoA hydratase/carnithine racemase